MFGSVVRVLRDPLSQRVALTNAQQAAARLAHRRRQREEVDTFLAQLPGREESRRPMNSPQVR
ncbi:MAG: hypothetical protein ACXVGN_00310 [Mycobacteriaceae bacterium]